MKQLHAAFIPGIDTAENLSGLSAALDLSGKHAINNLLWTKSGYRPEVNFVIGYTEQGIALKYFVKEQHTAAVYTTANAPVYKDSCVEFFIGFDTDGSYYNLEFNALGTALVGYGINRHNREEIPRAKVEKIKALSNMSLADGDATLNSWELTLLIPFEVFIHHHLTTLKQRGCRVNFFKCGDDLPEPHFLSWNNIPTADPDFHLPQFFGTLLFD
ncbi:cellulose/xylan binding protein with CBM9 domain [Mucilaginibacter oryzae]|uniref:Cellulose/xylan binding protein with CBM9 domain n=1 Tax=Mucilaginibacter oryzae TaxID=468058 RepID=A0A316H9K9_9SPHI|nr:carbohydrate-binding family 9-like protein [Mucilaginibacter oryzae]PWK77157.1 cellulose/xylan binding protein with CBM9 domain [Mucilaginibacter oryzae]